jgi:hypothetical protein
MRFVMMNWPGRAVAGVAMAIAASVSGCSSGSPSGTLTVSVIQEGGPITPGGQTPRNPVGNAPVLVTGGTQTWTAHTGKAGSATITLPPGTYQVIDPECNQGPRTVSISAGGSATVPITCIVP